MNDKTDKKLKRTGIITVILFLIFIFGLGIWLVARPKDEFSLKENTYLSQWPEFTFADFFSGKWTGDVEEFVSDQFPMRDRWIVAQAAMAKASGRKDNNGVYFGESLISTYWKYDQKTLDKNLEDIEKLASELRNRGDALSSASVGEASFSGEIYFVPVPNEVQISQKLPEYYPDISQQDVIKYMGTLVSSVRLIDVTDVLMKADDICEYDSDNKVQKKDVEIETDRLYYKTDHHQTTKGAYIVYSEICRSMGLETIPEQDFAKNVVSDSFMGTLYNKSGAWWTLPDMIERWDYIGNDETEKSKNIIVELPMSGVVFDTMFNETALEGADQYTYFLYGNQPVEVIKISGYVPEKKLLVIKDSYAHAVVPFLTNHFSEIHMLDLRYFRGNVIDYMEENRILDADVLFLYNVSNISGG